MSAIVYLNGSLLPQSQAKVSVMDRGFIYGYGFFTTMRAYGGRVFRLARHWERLRGAARTLGFEAELARYDYEKAVSDTLKANDLVEASVRATVSAGLGERWAPAPQGPVTLLLQAQPYAQLPDAAYQAGIAAIVPKVRRNSQSPVPFLKPTCYLEAYLALQEAYAASAQEAIFLNDQGHLAEGTTCNLFLAREGKLLTPTIDCGVLPGITRQAIIEEVAPSLGIEVREGKLGAEELWRAEEVFVTSSLREIMPITTLEGKPVGQGRCGPLTWRLIEAFRELVRRETAPLSV